MKLLFNKYILLIPFLTSSLTLMAQGRPASVKAVPIKKLLMAPIRLLPAFTKAKYITNIKAESTGRLSELAPIGSHFTTNQSMGLITDNEYDLRTNEINSQILSNKAQVEYLTAESKRLNSLKNLTSSSAIEKNQSDLKIAKGDLAQSNSRLQQLQNDINKLTIVAPFNGFISQHQAQPGQYVNKGQDIMQYMSSDAIEIIAKIPFKYKAMIKIGETWQLDDTNRHRHNATITQFVPAATDNSRQIQVYFTSLNTDLIPGEPVTLLMPEAKAKQVLAVPRDALVLRRKGIYIFIIKDDIAHKVEVITGLAHDELIEVLGDGFQADDLVVTRGNERLRDQQSVKILSAK
ncbi:MAG: efflux RND transporter periplasmic adaptor subunit [Proteobacteria bacterium]|nr:efflux RND transporter periplasmic adaptor subunit [Pseudomonadota bacterium]